jgi:hypothetical protein
MLPFLTGNDASKGRFDPLSVAALKAGEWMVQMAFPNSRASLRGMDKSGGASSSSILLFGLGTPLSDSRWSSARWADISGEGGIRTLSTL